MKLNNIIVKFQLVFMWKTSKERKKEQTKENFQYQDWKQHIWYTNHNSLLPCKLEYKWIWMLKHSFTLCHGSINHNLRSITCTQYSILRKHLIMKAFLKHKLPTHIKSSCCHTRHIAKLKKKVTQSHVYNGATSEPTMTWYV